MGEYDMLNLFEHQLCNIQGKLFELSLKKGYTSEEFIEKFMNSTISAHIDDSFDRLQWAGEEYILEDLNEEVGRNK